MDLSRLLKACQLLSHTMYPRRSYGGIQKLHEHNFTCVSPLNPPTLGGHFRYCPEATVSLVPIWKRGVSKRGILKSLVSHFLNFKSWIKFIYDKIIYIYCVINEFNPTFEIQKMGSEAFQNALFVNASFPNRNEGYSCLWALRRYR